METNNDTTHTPTPWEIYDTSKTHRKGRVFITGGAVMLAELPKWGDGKDLANAAFIVRAVNSHEELLEAAKRLIHDIDNGEGISGQSIDDMKAAINKACG